VRLWLSFGRHHCGRCSLQEGFQTHSLPGVGGRGRSPLICHICNVYIYYSQIVKNLAKSLTNTAHTDLCDGHRPRSSHILTVHSLNDVKHIISRNDMGKQWKTWDYPNYMGNHGNICGPFNNYPSHGYGFSTRMHQVYAGTMWDPQCHRHHKPVRSRGSSLLVYPYLGSLVIRTKWLILEK